MHRTHVRSQRPETESRSGRGLLEVALVAGRTVVTRARAGNPLKLLAPRPRSPVAWVYTTTFGGGMLAGDITDLEVHVGAGATCAMSTQSATKVYKSLDGHHSKQILRGTVADGGTLVLTPDPVTCFDGALYEQEQRFEVEPGGTLLAIDQLTSGRRERGERWAFTSYRSRLDVFHAREHVLADALHLDPMDGALDAPHRMGRFNCLAIVAMIGKRLSKISRALVEEIGKLPLEPQAPVLEVASPISCGAVLRVLGTTPERVERRLRERLLFLGDLLGETPWARKW